MRQSTADEGPTFAYTTGGTLAPDAPSYVERQADLNLLFHLKEGETCYVLNSRQMGKSSLCVRTILRLKEAGVRTAFLDLTKFGGRNLTAEQWYAALLSEIGRELGLRGEFLGYWKDNADLPPVQRLFGALVEVGLKEDSPVVVFIDEIDVTLSLPFSADEFFAAIRQCYVGRATDERLKQLSFCLLGTATPADLIQDTRVSPFNIGKRIELRDFTAQEAAPLATGLGDSALLDRVLHWTGGHPYLTQRLCQAVMDSKSNDVDKVCSDLFLTQSAKEGDDNLAFVRNRLLKSEADLAALLDLYKKMRSGKSVPDDETNPLCALLKLSGVAKVETGNLKVRNRIYEHVFDQDWVETHMPDAEKRRQKEAYRRGVTRAVMWGGAVVVAFAVISAIAISNASQSRTARTLAVEQRKRADQLLYEAQMRLVQQAWESDSVGQALGFLEATKDSPYKGFEWYYWQRLVHPKEVLLTLRGHTDYANMAVFSPDGRLLASCSDDKTARIWNADTGGQLLAFRGHQGEVKGIAFSPDGERVATASMDKTAKVWDSKTGQEILTLRGHSGGLWNVAFSPDGKTLATVSEDFTARIWESTTGALIHTLRGHTGWVVNLAFSPDGKQLATGGNDSEAVVWETSSGRKLMNLKGHRDYVNHILFTLDGKRVVTGSTDRTIKVWDSTTGSIVLDIKQPDLVFGLTLSPDGRTFASASGGSVKLLDTQNGAEISTLRGHLKRLGSVKFSPDGKRLVTASYDKSVKVWSLTSQGSADVMRGHSGFVVSVQISPGGDSLVSASFDKTVKVWDAETGVCKMTLRGHGSPVMEATFSPDGSRIASASNDLTVKIWDATTGKEIGTLRGHTDDVNSVAYSPDGRLLATGSADKTIKVFEMPSGREIRSFKGHTGAVLRVRFSPDGKRLASASFDKTAKVWDVSTGEALFTLSGHARGLNAIAYSPDGKRIATGSEDGAVKVWDAITGLTLRTLAGHRSDIISVHFSPDGRRLATCADTAKLWDSETGNEVLTLNGHADWVGSLAFSRDGDRVFTASYDRTLRVWYAATPAQVLRWRNEDDREAEK